MVGCLRGFVLVHDMTSLMGPGSNFDLFNVRSKMASNKDASSFPTGCKLSLPLSSHLSAGPKQRAESKRSLGHYIWTDKSVHCPSPFVVNRSSRGLDICRGRGRKGQAEGDCGVRFTSSCISSQGCVEAVGQYMKAQKTTEGPKAPCTHKFPGMGVIWGEETESDLELMVHCSHQEWKNIEILKTFLAEFQDKEHLPVARGTIPWTGQLQPDCVR